MDTSLSAFNGLSRLLRQVRAQSEQLCKPLATEDYVIQAMPDVSPTKWHLAHVSWFFETFLLQPYIKDYQVFHPHYRTIFNSYYEGIGSFHPRAQRGLLSRPTVDEIIRYRHYVDEYLQKLLQNPPLDQFQQLIFRLQLGINHEQQHQELMLMDIKFNFANNPLRPAYCEQPTPPTSPEVINHEPAAPAWQEYTGGIYSIGHTGQGFAFDNETPVHSIYLEPFKINNQLVTNGEYLAFMEDGGYRRPLLWLSDGWQQVLKEQWQAPLYWEQHENKWWVMTLQGLLPLNLQEPVCHVSYYEADAYARWAQARLPTEAEWEISASQEASLAGNFLETGLYHPQPAGNYGSNRQLFGDVWEWTSSPYVPYPGFRPFAGLFAEYNGKFACNQLVLRGGCAVTPSNHIRASYRNFYYPHQRWPFTGIRLAAYLF